jgi:hypothetical protein
VLQALEEDANALTRVYSRDQQERLGIAGPRTPLDEAMWDNDPDHVEWKKQELERARKLAEWHDPNKLAAEVRDIR